MKTSIKDSTRRADPVCPSKNLRSLSVPFLADLNKKCRALKNIHSAGKRRYWKQGKAPFPGAKGKEMPVFYI